MRMTSVAVMCKTSVGQQVHAATYAGESSVFIWLRKMTISACTTLAGQRARHDERIISRDPGQPPDRGAEEAISAVELDELRRWALGEVPEEQRAAFVLGHLLDLPVEQIAELQAVRPMTVYTRTFRARQHLVELLDYRQVIDLLRRDRP